MKIVKPAALYLDPAAYTHPYQFIEKVGRTCYKSEDRITADSAVKFVSGLVSRSHWAMLEHAYVYTAVETEEQKAMLRNASPDMLRYIHINPTGTMFSASFRALAEFLRVADKKDASARLLHSQLRELYPEVFGESEGVRPGQKAWNIMTREAFIDRSDAATLHVCLPHTVLFTADRGVTHELVRHRPASYAQESTRYCNYSNGKFGREITVVEPAWAAEQKDVPKYDIWLRGCQEAERNYMAMLDAGAIPQEARALLPQSVKADIIVTATEEEWQHILNLRLHGTTGAPHPDIRRVMLLAAPQLKEHFGGPHL